MNPTFHNACTPVWRRLAAALLDVALIVGTLGVIEWALRETGTGAATDPATLASVSLSLLIGAPALLIFWLLFQASPGKLLLDCRIVDARSGGEPRVRQLLVRGAGYVLAAAPLGLGLLWMLWDRRRQGWHDKLAHTLVIDDDESQKSLALLAAEARLR